MAGPADRPSASERPATKTGGGPPSFRETLQAMTDPDDELHRLINQVAADAEAARECDDVDLSGVRITRGDPDGSTSQR